MKKKQKKTYLVDKEFENRNWLLLVRLDKMGFTIEEADRIARAIESDEIRFKEVVREGKKILKRLKGK